MTKIDLRDAYLLSKTTRTDEAINLWATQEAPVVTKLSVREYFGDYPHAQLHSRNDYLIENEHNLRAIRHGLAMDAIVTGNEAAEAHLDATKDNMYSEYMIMLKTYEGHKEYHFSTVEAK